LNLSNQLAVQNSVVTPGGVGIVFDSSVSGNAFTFGGLSGSANLSLLNSASTAIVLTVGKNNNTGMSYSGIVSGAGGLIKTGTGTQTLAGANTYTGATTVNGGTLAVTGSLATGSAVTVGGATATGSPILTGTGTVNGTLSIAAAGGGAAGTVNPGGVGTVGILATGSATIAGTYACDISGATADKLVVTGNLDISAATLVVTGTPTATSYVIATYTGTETGSAFAAISPALPTGYSVKVDTTNKQVLIQKSGYDSWASGKGLTAGVNDGPLQDPNNNGTSNLLEYVLNGDPLNGESPASILPTENSSGADFVFDFHRLHDSASDTTQVFQYGTDLTGWTDVAIPASGTVGIVAVTADSATIDHVTVTVPKGANTKLFGRLNVTKP
jgi:autotransporter-associated beta strand protein